VLASLIKPDKTQYVSAVQSDESFFIVFTLVVTVSQLPLVAESVRVSSPQSLPSTKDMLAPATSFPFRYPPVVSLLDTLDKFLLDVFVAVSLSIVSKFTS